MAALLNKAGDRFQFDLAECPNMDWSRERRVVVTLSQNGQTISSDFDAFDFLHLARALLLSQRSALREMEVNNPICVSNAGDEFQVSMLASERGVIAECRLDAREARQLAVLLGAPMTADEASSPDKKER